MSTKKTLAGKVTVVTGSTQGLGAAIATLYVKEGAKVVLTGLSSADGNALAKTLGRNSIFEQTDLSRVDDCRHLIEVALKRFGQIDILVNNAVDATRATVDDVSPDVFDRIFAVNVRAPLLLAHHAIASLRRLRGVQGRAADRIAEPRQLSQVRSSPRLLLEHRLDELRR